MDSYIERLEASFRPYRDAGLTQARVVAVHRDRWELSPAGTDSALSLPAVLAGKLRRETPNAAGLPAVGDWVAAALADSGSDSVIHAVLPRKGLLSRKRPGDVDGDVVAEQAIAANVDLAVLAMAVDDDFSPRRLERYLTLAWDSGAKPLVALTKSDLSAEGKAPSIDIRVAEAEASAMGAPVLVTSARTGEGIEDLRARLKPGSCAILLGSSGVGKSSLLNALAGTDLQAVTAVRDFDGKGRHTTTSRRLVALPWGAYLVDTPGLRELQLWGDESSLAGSFPDVEALAAGCRFADCSHEGEPGCAVAAAVEAGELSEERWGSWQRLRKELAYLARKADPSAARAEREKWKRIALLQKSLKKTRR